MYRKEWTNSNLQFVHPERERERERERYSNDSTQTFTPSYESSKYSNKSCQIMHILFRVWWVTDLLLYFLILLTMHIHLQQVMNH